MDSLLNWIQFTFQLICVTAFTVAIKPDASLYPNGAVVLLGPHYEMP